MDPATEPTGLDIEAAADSIGADLFPSPQTEQADLDATADPSTPAASAAAVEPAPLAAAPVMEVPKSWPKEMHDHWGKTPREVQEYWGKREKQMLDGLDQYKANAQFGQALRQVIDPYRHLVPEPQLPQAIQSLLVAHQRLTNGTPESRLAAYHELGRSLGLAQPGQATPPPSLSPELMTMQQQLQQVQQVLTAQQQAAYEEAKSKAEKEVETFASDTKTHPHFDEVHEDIVTFIKAGLSLQDAYDRAVWANPVTRAKEQARLQTEAVAKEKENARLAALPKKKATSVNVRTHDSTRTPTEPLGSMEDTMRSVLAERRERVH